MRNSSAFLRRLGIAVVVVAILGALIALWPIVSVALL
jgi:hypothetical protein